jgi:LEA14-like dessication related protein
MKRPLLITLIVILVLAVCGIAYVYLFPKKWQNIFVPDVEQVENVSIRLSGDTAFAVLLLRLENKGPFKMHIDSLDYRVNFDTLRVLSKQQFINLEMQPGDRDTFHFPVSLPYKRIIARAAELKHRDSVDITSEIRIVYSTVFGRKVLPRKKTDRIPVPLPPKFEIVKVDFRGFSGGKLLLNARLRMINEGSLELRLHGLRSYLKLAEILDATGTHSDTIVIRPRSNLEKDLAIEVTLNKPLTVLRAINDGMLPYSVKVTGFLLSEEEEGRDTRIEITNRGEVPVKELLKQAGMSR